LPYAQARKCYLPFNRNVGSVFILNYDENDGRVALLDEEFQSELAEVYADRPKWQLGAVATRRCDRRTTS
jgi:hypothetical protein